MIKETVLAAGACADQLGVTKPDILAVTVLTSLDDHDLDEVGFKKKTKDLVLDLARMAIAAGATGFVASPQDISVLRDNLGDKFVIVTPGIRAGKKIKNTDDQKRTLSAYEAIRMGADYIVVGRPIRTAEKPLEACHQIIQEITEALAAER